MCSESLKSKTCSSKSGKCSYRYSVKNIVRKIYEKSDENVEGDKKLEEKNKTEKTKEKVEVKNKEKDEKTNEKVDKIDRGFLKELMR